MWKFAPHLRTKNSIRRKQQKKENTSSSLHTGQRPEWQKLMWKKNLSFPCIGQTSLPRYELKKLISSDLEGPFDHGRLKR